jgi:PTS system mannose-specific IIA component
MKARPAFFLHLQHIFLALIIRLMKYERSRRWRHFPEGICSMIGLVVVTHGALGREFRLALEHVLGPQTHFETIAIKADHDREEMIGEIRRNIEKADSGEGVLILTDIFGGTPSNLAIDAMGGLPAELISGINLPMLIAIANMRKDRGLDEVASEARSAGRRYIHLASDMLCRFPRPDDGRKAER